MNKHVKKKKTLRAAIFTNGMKGRINYIRSCYLNFYRDKKKEFFSMYDWTLFFSFLRSSFSLHGLTRQPVGHFGVVRPLTSRVFRCQKNIRETCASFRDDPASWAMPRFSLVFERAAAINVTISHTFCWSALPCFRLEIPEEKFACVRRVNSEETAE